MKPARRKALRPGRLVAALYVVAAVEIVWLAGLLRFTRDMHGSSATYATAAQRTAGPSEPRTEGPEAVGAIAMYGPPSPPKPVYGPPTPPSRVPLLARNLSVPSPGVMQVNAEATRPVDAEADGERLGPYGWKGLALTRGIPFAPTQNPPVAGPPTSGAEPAGSDGPRRLFSQAAPEPEPVGIVYCVDAGIGAESPGRLASVRQALRSALASLRPRDSYWVLVLQDGGRPLDAQPASPTDENLRKTGAALDGLEPAPSAPLAPALNRAIAARGVGWIVFTASGTGALDGPDTEALKQAGARASAAGVRVIALVTGDGKSTERARALRDLAVLTRGAFAWLRPGD